MISLNDELAIEYLAECRERLAILEQELLALENGEADVTGQRLDRIVQAVRSIKADAAYLDLVKVGDLARRTEELVAPIRSGGPVPRPDWVRILLRVTDWMGELLENPGGSNQADVTEAMAELGVLSTGHQFAAGECGLTPDPARPGESIVFPAGG